MTSTPMYTSIKTKAAQDAVGMLPSLQQQASPAAAHATEAATATAATATAAAATAAAQGTP